MEAIESAAFKATLAAAALAILSFRILRGRTHPPSWYGVAPSPALPTIGFVAVYLGWMLASDWMIAWRGPWDFRPWQEAPLAASAMRLLAVCVLGPAVEEILFRGLLFSYLRQYLPVAAVIALTAGGWALLHWDYDWAVIGVIFVDGLLLGLARWRTGSLVAPILMHMLYNLYAIW